MSGLTDLDHRFDRFLYAPICERNEITVSVLSALTRQDIDPWQLAAQLTRLPKAQAVKCLASIVEESDTRRWSRSEANEVAARLVEFLPSQNNSELIAFSMETLKEQLVIWITFGIFWGMLVVYARTPQETANNYNDLSGTRSVVSQQAPSPRNPSAETSSVGVFPPSK
jgi:hypothetical protein